MGGHVSKPRAARTEMIMKITTDGDYALLLIVQWMDLWHVQTLPTMNGQYDGVVANRIEFSFVQTSNFRSFNLIYLLESLIPTVA